MLRTCGLLLLFQGTLTSKKRVIMDKSSMKMEVEHGDDARAGICV